MRPSNFEPSSITMDAMRVPDFTTAVFSRRRLRITTRTLAWSSISRKTCSPTFVCLIGAATAATAAGQAYQAQIAGVVRDSTGAVIPNARLKATNIATGVESSAESNDQGIYRFLALPPAQYKVSSNMTGFKSFE